MNNILEYRDWINNNYSINDISFFTFLSSLDYFGQIDWYNFPALKTWYSRLKLITPFPKILQVDQMIIGFLKTCLTILLLKK